MEPIWTIDTLNYRIMGPNGWVKMHLKEYQLASFLIQNPNKTWHKDEILSRAFKENIKSFQTRKVDYHIGQLRKKFELDPKKPKHFITHYQFGLRFEG